MRKIFAVLMGILASPLAAAPLDAHLKEHGAAPAAYVLEKLTQHRIVIAGENHWQRADVELIRDLVPELRRRKIALAIELFQASSQSDIDALIAAPEWDPARAVAILRAASWPYVQYRDILRAAWEASRGEDMKMRIIATGPPHDFREKKIRYDEFMADLIGSYAVDDEHRVLVYCGMHHAFTRFLQINRLIGGRVDEFMDRTGNILWRRFGEHVFLIALHKADPCGGWDSPFAKLCAPLEGAIDCAALAARGRAVAFDILGSPLAETKLPPSSFYAVGHPLVRMIEYADGYVWQGAVDQIRLVDLLPLEEYAPEHASDPERIAAWEKRRTDLANPGARASWTSLATWRDGCPAAKAQQP